MPAQTASNPSATVPPALPEKAHHSSKNAKPESHHAVTSGAGGEVHAEAKKEPLAPSEKGAKKAEVQGVVVDDKLKKKVVAA